MKLIKDITFRLFNGILQYSDLNNINWKPLINSIINTTSGFNLKLEHIGKYIRINSATDTIVSIDNPIFEIGSSVVFEQTGLGTITMFSDIDIINGDPTTIGQYKCIQIIKVSSNVWTAIGGTI